MAKSLKIETLIVPSAMSPTGWELPENMMLEEWLGCAKSFNKAVTGIQWWMGDWWNYGTNRGWGDGPELAERAGVNYQTVRIYGHVAGQFELLRRRNNLSFEHHREAASADTKEEQDKLLDLAEGKGGTKRLSCAQLRGVKRQKNAIERTHLVEMKAEELGKYTVFYADPPWRYEHNPMGGNNRSIEKEYPTMDLEEICALPVKDIAADDSVLYLWVSNPKLFEAARVLDAWGFEYKTNMVWVKDKIGMGYYFREQHELLLVGKRGKMPRAPASTLWNSVLNAPRLEHSAKPKDIYNMLDIYYPNVRKLEIFSRLKEPRENWTTWGNQA